MSETKVKNIYEKVHSIMSKLQGVAKDGKNTHHGYAFNSHDGVTKAIRPLMIEEGIISIPRVVKERIEQGYLILNVNIEYSSIGDGNVGITVPSVGMARLDPVAPGIALSYACKIADLKLFKLETGLDAEKAH